MLLSLLQSAPLVFALIAFILLYSLALHELGHAWVADKVGDKTARNLGRVTLNPLKHLRPPRHTAHLGGGLWLGETCTDSAR